MSNLNKKIKRLEDKDYADKVNQQGRVFQVGYRAASKKVAVDAGTRRKRLTKTGVALVKRHYVAWKKNYPSMRGFYAQLCAKNIKCLKGYEAVRLGRFCRNPVFKKALRTIPTR